MDEFEEAFNAQQNALPPSERTPEEVRDTIMLDQFVEVAGGVQRNHLRGQGNASSLVIRTPMGYRLDPSSTFSSSSSFARSNAAVDFEEMERRLKADNDARVQAEVASQLQSHMDTMRSRLRAEARDDIELIVQRRLSQRGCCYIFLVLRLFLYACCVHYFFVVAGILVPILLPCWWNKIWFLFY
ncbi:uncharacterized protein LOC123881385 [Trifolium pratense]|uniref:uncharacterized protein LOC123881385 n=1 Tax=Trifolium pratense TaxID=57577 RepID=UPI001E6905DD|nr:uncharacterized protein LOC123881385 [Trifolium pratense]XP_045786016.1 uncharacterized protein LOC123881385 [Trifolium pratense]XP_045786017.1 uncharacterized protein LOC123881385 [Trifolium pratense]XP_045786018.1 uncharacterized protein LOC123881385 [Trifolium pratense]XP_045786019.1 uncharacterized protein LOC123881385 [Trifolium pratense]XP_045786021.1 uncharacterized protein LOC123881385 [Trifolium pratense]